MESYSSSAVDDEDERRAQLIAACPQIPRSLSINKISSAEDKTITTLCHEQLQKLGQYIALFIEHQI